MPTGRFVRLTVTDTGCGMTPEVVRRAFEPFFTTKESGKGTGLGLSTVYGAVKEASGTITLHSELGKGTQINVYLPSTGRSVTAESSTIDVAATGHGEHILVVDDNQALLTVTARMLTKAGYHVAEASTREQAVDLSNDTDLELDLLLADIVMPGMSAPDLVDVVRASRPGTPVAFMSGYAADRGCGSRPLPEDIPILTKPFDATALLRTVRTALDGA
jgi:CheY-like chemotaxis protein